MAASGMPTTGKLTIKKVASPKVGVMPKPVKVAPNTMPPKMNVKVGQMPPNHR